MSLESEIQKWADGFFSQLEAEYQHRPLILAVLAKIKRTLDAQIPVLVQQGKDAACAALIEVIDKEFARLIEATAGVAYLGDLLKEINRWIDREILQLGHDW